MFNYDHLKNDKRWEQLPLYDKVKEIVGSHNYMIHHFSPKRYKIIKQKTYDILVRILKEEGVLKEYEQFLQGLSVL